MLMIEIFTPTTNSLCNDLSDSCGNDGLSEEDQLFFTSIKNNLDTLKMQPDQKTINAILNYAKSL